MSSEPNKARGVLWTVTAHIDYDSSEVVAVFMDRDKAERRAWREDHGRHGILCDMHIEIREYGEPCRTTGEMPLLKSWRSPRMPVASDFQKRSPEEIQQCMETYRAAVLRFDHGDLSKESEQ